MFYLFGFWGDDGVNLFLKGIDMLWGFGCLSFFVFSNLVIWFLGSMGNVISLRMMFFRFIFSI